MKTEQKEKLENLINHIRDNAVELVENTHISNEQIFTALYRKGIECLSNQSDQNIVDVGALALAFKVRKS